MSDTLIQAYLPLLVWTGLGLLICRFLPAAFPRLLGRALYWIGVPLQIFTLARQTQITVAVGLTPFVTIAALITGLGLGWSGLQWLRWRSIPDSSDIWEARSRQGSFILSTMIGNTGFVGLAIAPTFIDPAYHGWLVFYSVTQNLIGTYGIGVAISSYFGRDAKQNRWWMQVRDVLTVPSLWAFIVGTLTRPVAFPDLFEVGLHRSIWIVIPCALTLMGIRLAQLQGWKSLRLAIVPACLKVVLMPLLVGIATTLIDFEPSARLAMVLMSGMPTAFAGLILAEEYELDRELIASSILLSTILLLLTIPLWLLLFHVL
ncbi:AEC family transporter [Microcoleus sp. FACHB-1515]|uniref:AEC family transporter n=1 Tax=Cyanophyceae TaxID=3028117 RepID=UPI001687DDF2|nr:AEC family transporter [Microcoleus sp. FACHB-1515]MBD2091955.1 AEC family transporter [Microcoleus sp. FACHB-1515]